MIVIDSLYFFRKRKEKLAASGLLTKYNLQKKKRMKKQTPTPILRHLCTGRRDHNNNNNNKEIEEINKKGKKIYIYS